MRQLRLNPAPFSRISKTIEVLLLLIATVFLALHALHLNADFPNHSPWMDWAKYTDEGWYGDAAIRYFQRGHWNVPGDFNPAAALPIWPLLEAALFRFTGVNLLAARAFTVGIFALILLAVYLLLRRWQTLDSQERSLDEHNPASSLVPAIAVLLLAVSPFCYAFTRLAILEPLLILLTLLALLSASYIGSEQGSEASPLRGSLPDLALGLLLPLMVLTKTTAIFLLPSVVWILWARSGYQLRSLLRNSFISASIATTLWLGYYLLLIRPHFLADFHYLFDANGYTKITAATAFSVLSDTFTDGLWMGRIFYPLATLCGIVALFGRRYRSNPLVVSLLLWAVGYTAFLAYHDNLQPRYYLVVAIPLTLLVPIVLAGVMKSASHNRVLTLATAGALVLLVCTDARQTLHYVRTPEYTFTSAASRIRNIITSDRTHNHLVLSISGSDLSLMTGLPSICDDFGTLDLPVRVRAYHPGWYVAWNYVEDDKMEALAPMYHLRRVAEFPAFDDPERNLLILYRLDPVHPATPAHPDHRRTATHLFQTSFTPQPPRIRLER